MSAIDVDYFSSSKAWMTNLLFNKYLLDLNQRFQRQDRSVLLFLDNAPVHIVDEATNDLLTHVKLQFFPPNLTSVLQPLDAGIIRSLKCYTRRLQVTQLLEELGEFDGHVADLVKKLNVLDAMKFVSGSWNLIKEETIIKCFRNCGFHQEIEEEHFIDNDDDNEAQLAALMRLVGVDGDPVIEEKLQEFDVSDDSEQLVEIIIEEFKSEFNEGDDSDVDAGIDGEPDDVVPPPPRPTARINIPDAISACSKLMQYCRENGMIEKEAQLLELNGLLRVKRSSSLRQRSIVESFSTNNHNNNKKI